MIFSKSIVINFMLHRKDSLLENLKENENNNFNL